MELELPNAKGIRPAEPGSQLAAKPSPPLTVAALNLRLHMDPKTQSQEILAASVVHVSGEGGVYTDFLRVFVWGQGYGAVRWTTFTHKGPVIKVACPSRCLDL